MVALLQLHGLPTHAAERKPHYDMQSEGQLAHLCSAITLWALYQSVARWRIGHMARFLGARAKICRTAQVQRAFVPYCGSVDGVDFEIRF
jgi:hypothetical protein